MSDRPYSESTMSLCGVCLRDLDARLIIERGRVFMLKTCPEHGHQKVLISTDAEYYLRCRRMNWPGKLPLRFNSKVDRGCPHDCGICPQHQQHGCVILVEITDQCNLGCPLCYAGSSPESGQHRSLEQIEFMLDCAVANEGEPEVIQISGGEPTIHPQFFEVLDAAKRRPIRHLMVNTNGLRIAEDEQFARRLKDYMPGLDVYLQFDSLKAEPLRRLRGRDLRDIRFAAMERLNRLGISTTLVVALQKGVNDREIGAIIDYALAHRCLRGITFQPMQMAGRFDRTDSASRITLSEVRREILRQSRIFKPADIVPVPCHPDCLAMGYALKLEGRVLPLARLVDVPRLLEGGGNTIAFEKQPHMREGVAKLFSASAASRSAGWLNKLMCCFPRPNLPANLTYENVFRIVIMRFMDAWDFDARSVKRSCVQIVHPDGRMIPFDTYNLFHRGTTIRAAGEVVE